MRTIRHYTIQMLPSEQIEMPVGARVLAVERRDGHPFLLAIVDPDQTNTNTRTIFVFGPDDETIPNSIASAPYLGTLQAGFGDKSVWHVFDGGVS